MTQPFSSPRCAVPRIDAHHHLWHYSKEELAWIDDTMSPLKRDFLPEEFHGVLRASGVEAAVVVQARECLKETEWLLQCASSSSFVCGVVGWARIDAKDFPADILRFSNPGKLVGLREIVQDKDDGYLDRPAFDRGITYLAGLSMAYDLLIREQQLPEATRIVDRHPNQQFVLDHAAKPNIAAGELEPWATRMRELARRPNVSCKLSGLVTEANWNAWTLETFRPYLDLCVDAFGPDRLLAGSDWPVCLLAASYSQWWDLLAGYFADFSPTEAERIFGGNAMSVYGLHFPERGVL